MNPFTRLFKRTRPIEKKEYTVYDLMPQGRVQAKWTDYTFSQAKRNAFSKSTWVYACIRTRANNFASVPWVAEKRTSEGWVGNPESDLQRLIDRPNEDFSWSDLMRLSIYARDLSGDFYLTKERAGIDTGKTKWIFPLLPDSMGVVAGEYRLISKYIYRVGAIKKDIPAENIIHLKYSSPTSLYYGQAPLQAIARAVDIDEEAEMWQKKMLENMAIPTGVFSFDNIGQAEYDQAKKWVTEQIDRENRGRPLVVGNGKWQSMGQTAQELAFIQSRKLIREEICSGLCVQPIMIGILDNATLANIETAKKILWDEGLIPVLEETKAQINRQLIDSADERVNYDLTNVTALQDDYAEKIVTAQQMFNMGITLEQINERLELGITTNEMAHAKTSYLPSGLIPADMDIESITGSNEEGQRAYGDE